MMAGMPWIKIYTEMVDDVKLSRLTDAQKWRFIQLIILAGECDAGGALVTGDSRMTHEDVCWRLRCDSQTLENDIEKMIASGLITEKKGVLTVIKFSERQGPTQETKREAWRRRQEDHRNKVKDENVTGDKSVSHATEEEKKKREEEEEESGDDNFSLLPLGKVFCEESMLPECSGGPDQYYKGLQTMKDKGVTPEDLRKAIQILRHKEYPIISPVSCVVTAINVMAQRTRGGNGSNKSQYLHADGVTTEEF